MQNQIKQAYIPFWDWEDYKAGMWRKLPKSQELDMLNKCIKFTGNHVKYGDAMRVVVDKWHKTMLNSLTNNSINQRAFLGHCACSYTFACPEYITRRAWKRLTDKQRYLADHEAQQTINKWKQEYIRKSKTILIHGKEGVIKKESQMQLQLD